MKRRENLLARKKALGRKASYGILAEKLGINKAAVYRTLNDKPSPIPMDREEILRKVARALDELEAEEEDASEALAA